MLAASCKSNSCRPPTTTAVNMGGAFYGLLAFSQLLPVRHIQLWRIDFRSRFFAPRAGLAEDPVTGSAHCMLAPYWSQRLGRDPNGAEVVPRNPINNLNRSIIYLYQICIKCVYCSFDVSNCTDFSFESLNNLATMQLRLGFRPQLEEVLLNVS